MTPHIPSSHRSSNVALAPLLYSLRAPSRSVALDAVISVRYLARRAAAAGTHLRFGSRRLDNKPDEAHVSMDVLTFGRTFDVRVAARSSVADLPFFANLSYNPWR
jgi:hypothetical protein